MQNTTQKSAEVSVIKPLPEINKPKKITKVKSARRLLATLIFQYQKGEITSEYIKTLTYVLIKYQEIYKSEVLETIDDRLKKLEEKLLNEKS
jgi:hypothetical protein